MHPIIPLQGQFEGVNNDFKVGCFRQVLKLAVRKLILGSNAGSGGL